ncbi:MAG TPA: hypothetical protein VHF46_07985, partial [Rubrobacteraceae bacterium]|nr:hypothetical protein [Rubrobacteraceae bacterium]
MEERLVNYTLVTEASDLANITNALKGVEVVGLDIETTDLSPRNGRVRLLQLATPDETFVVDVFETGDLASLKEILESGPVKVLQNGKFDYSFLKAEHGISVSPIFDTMLAAQLLAGGDQSPSYALEAVAERHAGIEMDKSARGENWSGELSEAQIEYAARDAAVLLPLRERLTKELQEERLVRVAKIEFDAVAAIAEMELAGIKLNVAKWKELEKTIRKRRDEVALALDAQFPVPDGVLPLEGLGPRLNLNSPQQITDAFRSLGIDLPDT